MAKAGPCAKCGGTMTEGFVLDANYGSGSYGLARWIAGKPIKSIWTGLKLSGKDKRDITSWRCNRCGYLENYA